MSKVYLVFGTEYDSWYIGNCYGSRLECEKECEFINAQIDVVDEWREKQEGFRHNYREQNPNYDEEGYYPKLWEAENLFMKEVIGEYPDYTTDCRVSPMELDVKDLFIGINEDAPVDIHSAVINAFKQ